jgi:hypothetical protein
VLKSSLILAALVAGLSVPASAAEVGLADGQVPFEFMAGRSKLPAGHYKILASGDEDQVLMIMNVETKKTTLVEYTTRIAATTDGNAAFVFDQADGESVLSEIHVSGSDGYLLPGVGKKPHTHKQVKAS